MGVESLMELQHYHVADRGIAHEHTEQGERGKGFYQ